MILTGADFVKVRSRFRRACSGDRECPALELLGNVHNPVAILAQSKLKSDAGAILNADADQNKGNIKATLALAGLP